MDCSDVKISLSPIVDSNSTILLLGTMPGEESLRKQEYYGNKRNHFWQLIYAIFQEPFSENYDDRIKFLLSKKIALWDVLISCERIGSLDTNIKNAKINDFQSFFNKYGQIHSVFFTSRKAEEFYRRYTKGLDIKDKIYTILPSPSPANAHLSFEEKLVSWRSVFSTML